MGLPCGRVAPRTTKDASDIVMPENQIHPVRDDNQECQPDSEVRTRGSLTSNKSDTPVPRYRILMRRNHREFGVYPRSASPISVDTEP